MSADVERELGELKRALGVATDLELAAHLGLDRSTIAQWRRRGRLPGMYRALTAPLGDLQKALRGAVRGLVYRDPAYGFWTAAALSALDPGVFAARAGETAADRGLRLEAVITGVLHSCLNITQAELGKTRPQGVEDYAVLVERLASDAAHEVRDAARFESSMSSIDEAGFSAKPLLSKGLAADAD